jgi:alpha-galactosidase
LIADAWTLFAVAGETRLAVTLVVESDDGATHELDGWRRDGQNIIAKAGAMSLACRATTSHGGLRVSMTLAWAGAAPIRLRSARFSVSTAKLWPPTVAPSALRIAWCGAHSRSEESRSFARTLEHNELLTGWWVGALVFERSIVLGATDFRRFVTGVEHRRGSITALQQLENLTLEPGASLPLSPVWLCVAEGQPFAQLEAYATEVAAVHHAKPPAPVCGWGTWGHFFEEIDASLLRETAVTLDGIPGIREAVRLVQIDDGWSEMLSSGKVSASWRPNRRFPSGIAPLAAEITATGRECGLWMIPFTVNEGSALAGEHPEFLVRGADDAPQRVGGIGSFCIDPTHTRAAEWLGALFDDVHDWGVRYLKLDFLRGLLAPEPMHPMDGLAATRRYANATTRVEAYRRGLEIIRASMGRDAFLLACSAPAGPGAGIVSAHRVGPDIEPAWVGKAGGVRDAARAVAANWFWNGRTWANDADYVIPCESESATRFWATIVAMSGGSMILSADLAEMDRWVEELFAFIAPPIGKAARPLDLFENGPEPQLWSLPLSKAGRDWHVVAMCNWSDEPQELDLDLTLLGFGQAPVHLWDVWRRRHRVVRESTRILAEAHSAVLLRLTAVSAEPTVVGTDVHFGQGYLDLATEKWDATSRTLTLKGALRRGNAYVWSPATAGFASLSDGAFGDNVRCVPIVPGQLTAVTFSRSAPRKPGARKARVRSAGS